jgi:membrane protease YdiL (CAAX protease family)
VGRWWTAVLVTPVVVVLLGALALVWPELTPGLLAASDRGMVIRFALAVGLGAGFLEDLGWTGFALPRLLQHHGWLKAGVLLGLVWGLWHLLPDYWGNAAAWGPLYAPRYLVWCGASFTAYRILVGWAYRHTGSLLLAQLMHAGFTGGQALLSPVLAPSAGGLVWYAAFAAALWLLVGVVAAVEGVGQPHSGGAVRPARGDRLAGRSGPVALARLGTPLAPPAARRGPPCPLRLWLDRAPRGVDSSSPSNPRMAGT